MARVFTGICVAPLSYFTSEDRGQEGNSQAVGTHEGAAGSFFGAVLRVYDIKFECCFQKLPIGAIASKACPAVLEGPSCTPKAEV